MCILETEMTYCENIIVKRNMKVRRCMIAYMANLFIIVFALTSCGHDENTLLKNANDYFQKNNIIFDDKIRNCIIIPGGGCSGCIASGISFVLENKEVLKKSQSRNLIVFTNIFSEKMLKRQLHGEDMGKLNCIIDLQNKYLIPCNENIYPIILRLKNGNVVEVHLQSPDENGFEKIRNDL